MFPLLNRKNWLCKSFACWTWLTQHWVCFSAVQITLPFLRGCKESALLHYCTFLWHNRRYSSYLATVCSSVKIEIKKKQNTLHILCKVTYCKSIKLNIIFQILEDGKLQVPGSRNWDIKLGETVTVYHFQQYTWTSLALCLLFSHTGHLHWLKFHRLFPTN